MDLTNQYLQWIYRIKENPYLSATLFYTVEWLKSWSLEITVAWIYIRVTILFIHTHISTTMFRLVLSFPKYSLILTTESDYFYEYEGWYFYKLNIYKDLCFYIMHTIGEDISRLDEVKPTSKEVELYKDWIL